MVWHLMKEFIQNKLWRDKSVDLVIEHGSIVAWRKLEDEEFDQRLREKLLEEAKEVAEAKTKEELIEELADVLEILDTLIDLKGIEKTEVLKAQRAKIIARGGFKGRKYVETTKHPPESWQEAYCLKNPERYPEVS